MIQDSSKDETGSVTALLAAVRAGESQAWDRLMPIVYEDLRRVARRRLRLERTDHTLNTTALVHEAYERLVDQRWASVRDRAHFFAIAAQAMRRILVSHARRHNAGKRYGLAQRLPLDEDLVASLSMTDGEALQLVALDDELAALAAFNERGCRVVEYRVFAGLTHEEIAELMDLSVISVRRAWALARMWLRARLRNDIAEGSGAPSGSGEPQ